MIGVLVVLGSLCAIATGVDLYFNYTARRMAKRKESLTATELTKVALIDPGQASSPVPRSRPAASTPGVVI